MNISSKSFYPRIPLILFLCVFPIDAIFYTLRVLYGVPLPPIGLMAGILTLLFLLPRMKVNSKTVAMFFLVALFLMGGIINAILSPRPDFGWMMLYFWYMVSFFMGSQLQVNFQNNANLERNFIIAVSLLSSLISIIILKDGWFYTTTPFNYLRTASGVFYFSLLGLVVSSDKRVIVIIYIVTGFALFYINSRAYFYLWMFIPFLYAALATQLSLRYLLYLLLLVAAVYITIEAIDYLSPQNRVFRLFLDTEHDTSLDYRAQLFNRGWEQIKASPFLGNYNGYLEYGGKGAYIHNILSYWHQFGLLPFVTMVAMIGVAANNIFIRPGLSVSLFVKLSFVLTIIGLLFSHSYQQHAIFFVLGLSINNHLIRENNKHVMYTMGKVPRATRGL